MFFNQIFPVSLGVQKQNFSDHLSYNKPSSFVGSSMHAAEGFKNFLSNPDVASKAIQKGTASALSSQGIKPLNAHKDITREEAIKSAQDMMSAFYSQMFKSMFEEIRGDDDSHGYGMTKDMFVEQLAQSLGKHVSPTHEKIADHLMKGNANQASQIPSTDPSTSPLTLVTEAPAAEIKAKNVEEAHNQFKLPITSPWLLTTPPQEYWMGQTPQIKTQMMEVGHVA